MDYQIIEDANKSMRQTADYFYQDKLQLANVSLYHSILCITKTIEMLEKENYEGIPQINELLNEILQAMQQKDGTMIADLLNYELCEIFDGLINN